jgi:hypothetical protein
LCERFSGVERLARAFSDLLSLSYLSTRWFVSRAALYGLFWAARRCSPLSPRRKGFSFSLVKIMRTTCSGFNLLGVFFSLRARRTTYFRNPLHLARARAYRQEKGFRLGSARCMGSSNLPHGGFVVLCCAAPGGHSLFKIDFC